MNLLDLQTLADYHYWSRDRLLDAVAPLTPAQLTQDLANSFPSILDTLRHLIGAEMVWVSRWRGDSLEAMPLLRQLRVDPPKSMDLIAFYRERGAAAR